MADLFDADPLRNYMALYVGPNGAGKSIAIASFKKKGSIYYFDFDGRMNSVVNWYRSKGLKRGQLIADTYGPHNAFEAFTKLEEFANFCPHAAIVIDSFTAVTVTAVTFSLKRRLGKGAESSPKTTKGDLIIPDWEEWNGEATYVVMLLDLCKAIAAQGVNIFWTAHPVQRTKIEADGTRVGRVSTQTKYAAFGMKSDSLIPIFFNEIYYFMTEFDYQTEKTKRLCITQPYGEVAAKTALRIPTIIDWTDADFYDILSKEIKDGQEAINLEGEQYNELNEKLLTASAPYDGATSSEN